MLVTACGVVLVVFNADYQMEDCPHCSVLHFLLSSLRKWVAGGGKKEE